MNKFTLLILTLLAFGQVTIAQKKDDAKAAPAIDQKKLAKANALVAEAMKLKDKGAQNDKLMLAQELFRDMKMAKEGNVAIGDAFYNAGDLKTAARYYGKGGKENKTETNKKVGDAYLEDAFSETDPKLQKKAFENAFKSLSKAYGPNEANRLIGNEFFDLGVENYPKALEYYMKGNYKEGVYMIADIYASKPETVEKACETYTLTKEREGYKRAGDLHFGQGSYVKSMEYYAQGGVIEGYQKYAGELKKAGKTEMYNTVMEIITDTLKKNGKSDDIKSIAVQAEKDKNYPLAASLYNKLGNAELEKKYKAYMQMMNLEVISAKEIFAQIGKQDLANDIDKNIKQLTDIQQGMMTLKELKKNVPVVNAKLNPYNGKSEFDAADMKLRDQYYGNPANQKSIADVVYAIGKTYATVKASDELKTLVRQSLQQFAPVKNILDSYDMSKKIIPLNITPAAVTF